jgi:hypothetical protein
MADKIAERLPLENGGKVFQRNGPGRRMHTKVLKLIHYDTENRRKATLTRLK